MDRAAIAFAALLFAGCYRPAANDACAIRCDQSGACPDGRTCSAGYCLLAGAAACDPTMNPDTMPPFDGSGSDSGAVDAFVPPTSCLPTPFSGSGNATTGQTSYTASSGPSARGNDHVATRASDFYVYVDGTRAFPAHAELDSPHLAASGTEMFMAVGTTMMHSTLSAGTWSMPQAANMDLSDVSSFTPGTASETSPRRMAVSTLDGLFELTEATGGNWTSEPLLLNAGNLGYYDPSLSADGLRLVTMLSADGTVSIVMLTRTSVDLPFDTLQHTLLPLGNGSMARRPFMASDSCNTLSWDVSGDGYQLTH